MGELPPVPAEGNVLATIRNQDRRWGIPTCHPIPPAILGSTPHYPSRRTDASTPLLYLDIRRVSPLFRRTTSSAAAAALSDNELRKTRIAAAVCWSGWFGTRPLLRGADPSEDDRPHPFGGIDRRHGKLVITTPGHRVLRSVWTEESHHKAIPLGSDDFPTSDVTGLVRVGNRERELEPLCLGAE